MRYRLCLTFLWFGAIGAQASPPHGMDLGSRRVLLRPTRCDWGVAFTAKGFTLNDALRNTDGANRILSGFSVERHGIAFFHATLFLDRHASSDPGYMTGLVKIWTEAHPDWKDLKARSEAEGSSFTYARAPSKKEYLSIFAAYYAGFKKSELMSNSADGLRCQGRLLAGPGYFWYLEVAKADFKSADQPFFDAILASAQSAQQPRRDAWDALLEGNLDFVEGESQEAIKAYQQARDLAESAPGEPGLRRMATDNMALAFIRDKKPREARRLLEAAVSKDPSYPFYHYRIAQIEAAAGRYEAAWGALQTMQAHRKDLPADDVMPDPATDEAFASMREREPYRARMQSKSAPGQH